MDRGAWQATVHGVARIRHDLVTKPPPSDWFKAQLCHLLAVLLYTSHLPPLCLSFPICKNLGDSNNNMYLIVL